MEYISTLIYFIIALGLLVFVHELGHFLVAKKAGIRVERFSLGYPPKMFGITIGETEYCISWIPFGGYVKVAGMADVGTSETTGAPWEFPSKPIWVRMAVIAAGPFMNFAFAFVAFLGIFVAYGLDTYETTAVLPAEHSPAAQAGILRGDQVVRVNGQQVANEHRLLQALKSTHRRGVALELKRGDQVFQAELPASEQENYGLSVLLLTTVGQLVPDMPAVQIGLQPGDRITSVAQQPVGDWEQMKEQINSHPGENIPIEWEREGQRLQGQITPVAHTEGDKIVGQIGIGPKASQTGVGIGEALSLSGRVVYNSSWVILDFIRQIFKGDRSTDELGGPLRIAQMAGQTGEQGLKSFVSFLAMLSVNLAIINLLPIPVLDGGLLTFLTLEAIRRRPLTVRQQQLFQQVGLVIMLFIMVLVTFNDLNQMVFHRIISLFE
ncbi:MAG: RIP metalloprotease RseP [Candidatus Latescibacteria bacterium]|nr:RIP metalloprotease RseP [Candidatus Latescibacterota bacterium]